MNRKNIIVKWRIVLVLLFMIIVALTIETRLYFLQVLNREHYQERADQQYFSPQEKIFDRGSIFFSSKDGFEITAASLKVGYKLAINPSILEYPEDVFNNLSFDLDLDPEDFIFRTDRKDDTYEELAKRLEPEIAQKISDKNIDGVSVFKEKWRFYPAEDLASHVIGFMSFKGDEYKGRYGLENYYDEVLDQRNQNVFSNFFVEIFSNLKQIVVEDKKSKGSIHLTIEPTVQHFLEETLESVNEDWSSKKVGGIIMDPLTGEIIAMGLFPDFDLNTFNEVEDALIYRNDLVENVYEMGSIVKPLTMAIGLDTGVINKNSTYNDLGSMTYDGMTFSNYDRRARGVVNVQEILNQSLNTGVAHIVSLIGNEVFGDYLKKLIGSKTGIDLPNEAAPLVNNLNSNRDIEYATASFGQGIAMTPLGITRALAALGNGGLLVQPHLVKKIEYLSGFSSEIELNAPERIFKPETSENISRMLVRVVDEALKGGDVALKNHSIAAKTGTAQIAKTSESGYYNDRYLHSFFGYFPAFEPEFIVFLYVIEPQNVDYASETLTEPFINITKFLINYYEIPPDRESVVSKPI